MTRTGLAIALALALALALGVAVRPGRRDASHAHGARVPPPARELDVLRSAPRLRAAPGCEPASVRERRDPERADSELDPSSGGRLASVVARVATRAGAPVAHAALVLRHGARPAGRALVDAAGRARFAGLTPGHYSLEVDALSLAPGLVVAPGAPSGSTRVPFTLARGAVREVPLEVVLAATIRGSMLDAEDRPVAGTVLRLQALGTAFGGDTALGGDSRAVLADERGAFELLDVVPGTYGLLVQWPAGAPGAAPAPRVHTLEPGACLALTLRADGEPRAIVGRLVNEAGEALAGQIVQCEWIEDLVAERGTRRSRSGLEPPAPWSRVLARTRTDAEGRYRLAGLPRGEVAVRAAPRVGGAVGFGAGAATLVETLVGRFDLLACGTPVDAGRTVLCARTR